MRDRRWRYQWSCRSTRAAHSRNSVRAGGACAPAIGGLIRTELVDGFVVDAGADALLTQKPAGIALCRELGVDVVSRQGPRARLSRMVAGCARSGRWRVRHSHRLDMFARSRAFSDCGKTPHGWGIFPPARPSPDGTSQSRPSSRGVSAEKRCSASAIHCSPASMAAMRSDCRCARYFHDFVDLERTDRQRHSRPQTAAARGP